MMRLIIKYRLLVLLGLLGATFAFGFFIKDLTRDTGISALVPRDHPAYEYHQKIEDLFGATDQIVIGVTANDTIYTRESLVCIQELTDFLTNLDEIEEEDVLSLTTVSDLRGSDGDLLIEPLLGPDVMATLDAAGIEQLRTAVNSNPLFAGRLVSPDERSAVVIADVSGSITMQEHSLNTLKTNVLGKLTELRRAYPNVTINLSGPAMLKAYIAEYMQKDIRQLFPFAALVVTLMLFVLLRSFYGMCPPILVTLFSIVWTFGLKGLLRSPLTIIETSIPVVLIAIGCADGIHIISEFFVFYRRGDSTSDALTKTMRLLALPVTLTSVTTALGFVSLLSAPGVSLRNMGVFVGWGVMAAMVFSLCFIPALTTFYRGKRPRIAQQTQNGAALHVFYALAGRVGCGVLRQRWIVAALTLLLAGVAVLGIVNIKVESDEVRYFQPRNVFRLATEAIQRELGGITSLDIIFEADQMDALQDPALLKVIEEVQRLCEQDPLVSYTLSLTDLLKRINYVLHDNDPAYDRLPQEIEQVRYTAIEEVNGQETSVEKTEAISGREQIGQFLLLYEMSGGETTQDFVDDVYQTGRIVVRLRDMSSLPLKRLLASIQPYLAEHLPAGVTVGYANHYIRMVMMDLIIQSQIYSLLTVLVTITIVMCVNFRSVWVGVLTSLPVFIAVLLNFTVMWLFGVTLNIGTSIIASVGMGVGIDYAIHYMSRFRFVLSEVGDYEAALVRTIAETARPILFNASAVGLGFLVLLFSEYRIIASIGWITTLSMFTTAFSSLTILPALLAIVKPKVRAV